MSKVLVFDQVEVERAGRAVLQRISFTLNAGTILTIVGPNGAGKSTLVRAATGLLSPDRGKVWRAPGLRIGYVPQRLQLNALLPMTVQRFLDHPNPRQAHAALEQVGICALARQDLHALSGGEMQRVLLARALLRQPQLLVLDEPDQGVDLSGQAALYHLIGELRDQLGCAVLMVSHDLHLVMARSDEVLCLNHHICCHGHPEQVSMDPAYRNLFNERERQDVALYRHNHDHHHHLDGSPVPDNA